MRKVVAICLLCLAPIVGMPAAAAAAHIHVTWSRFHSNAYRYNILQPSSFRHVVLRDTANDRVDYFFPSLGSFTTNVNIWAESGDTLRNEGRYMHALGGRHVRAAGHLTIMGRHMLLTRGDFRGVAGQWSIEQVDFQAGGLTWHLTASYDVKYREVLPQLLRMLRSFRPE